MVDETELTFTVLWSTNVKSPVMTLWFGDLSVTSKAESQITHRSIDEGSSKQLLVQSAESLTIYSTEF